MKLQCFIGSIFKGHKRFTDSLRKLASRLRRTFPVGGGKRGKYDFSVSFRSREKYGWLDRIRLSACATVFYALINRRWALIGLRLQHGFGNRISRVSGDSVPARLRYCLFSTASQRHPAHRAVPQGEQPCTNARDLAGSYSI